MKQTLWLLLAIVIIGVGVLIFWLLRPRQSQEDCAFSGWKRTVGVELEAQVNNLDAIKSKIGISDAQVRDYDTLMKDYALKYDSACQDLRGGRMTQAEYTCLRKNMTSALDDVRQFVQAVEAAKSLGDATSQKQVILRALDNLHALSAAAYKSNCVSAMDVNPKKLSFTGLVPERSVQITNIGNNDFTYSVTDYTECLDPKPASGAVARGQTVSVALQRTLMPVSLTTIKFHIHTNLQDDAEVEVAIDAENASLWKKLGEQVQQRAEGNKSQVSVQDALAVVDNALGPKQVVAEADRYVLASCVLFKINENSAAQKAIDIATDKNPSIATRPSVLLLQGLVASQRSDPGKALQFFAKAKEAAPPADTTTRSVSNLFSGSVLLNQMKPAAAEQVLNDPNLIKRVAENPGLTFFSAKSVSPAENSGHVAMLNSNLNRTLNSLALK